MAEKVNLDVRGVIENMSWFTGDDGRRYEIFGAGGGQELADKLEVPLIGQIPLLSDVREGSDEGRPIVATDPDGQAGRAFAAIAEQLDVAMAPKRRYNPGLKLIDS
jgi:ATP-binding protein involved in chromosome partitioning